MPRPLVSLTELLAREDGVSKAQSQILSQEWTRSIIAELSGTNLSVIAGFGTLSKRGEKVEFMPDDALNLAHVLPPIEGYSERAASQAATPDAAPSGDASDSSDTASLSEAVSPPEAVSHSDEVSSSETQDTPISTLVDDTLVNDSPDEDQWDSQLAAAIRQADGTDIPDTADDDAITESAGTEEDATRVHDADRDPDSSGDSDSDSDAKDAPNTSADHDAIKKKPMTSHKSQSRTPHRNQSSSSKGALWLVGGLILLLVSALGYKYLIQGPASIAALDDSTILSDTTTSAPAEDQHVANPLIAQQDSSAVIISTEPAQIPAQTAPTVTTDSNNAEISSNDSITRNTSGYTLVVGSSMTLGGAQSAIVAFSSLDMPTGVLTYTINGVTRFRMGVGVFGSASEADDARATLRDQLPEGTWVRRIR